MTTDSFALILPGTTAADHKGAILVGSTGSKADAVAACRELNETLLTTEGPYFQSDMNSLLGYLSLNSRYNKQKFWVESTDDAPCSVLSFHNSLQSVPCNSQFPALCSQSAPYRSSGNVDPNPAFQVQVQSKKLTVIGCVFLVDLCVFAIWDLSIMFNLAHEITYRSASWVFPTQTHFNVSAIQSHTAEPEPSKHSITDRHAHKGAVVARIVFS